MSLIVALRVCSERRFPMPAVVTFDTLLARFSEEVQAHARLAMEAGQRIEVVETYHTVTRLDPKVRGFKRYALVIDGRTVAVKCYPFRSQRATYLSSSRR
jgi:hypothetical protein